MRRSTRCLAGLAVFLSLAGVSPARAASNAGLDERIRILQEAFTRFEKDRQDLQASLKAEQRARKDAEDALTKALKQVEALKEQKEDAELRGEEAAQVIEALQAAREEAARAAKDQEKALRRLETEVERLRALNERLERDSRKLQDRPAGGEAETEPVAESDAEEAVEPVAESPAEPAPAEGAASLESARKLIGEGQVAEAEALLRELANARRPDPEVLIELGRLQLKQKRFPEAIQSLQAAYRRDPRNKAVLKDLALACHGNKQLPEAIRYLNKVIELDAKDGEAYFNLAALYLMLPNPKPKDAAANYEQALKLGEPRDEKLEAILFR